MKPIAILLVLAASMLLVAWMPVFLHFFRQWRKRANPQSLAICMLVVLAAYMGMASCLILVKETDGNAWIIGALASVDAIACAFFHIAFRWSKARFPDTRRDEPQ